MGFAGGGFGLNAPTPGVRQGRALSAMGIQPLCYAQANIHSSTRPISQLGSSLTHPDVG